MQDPNRKQLCFSSPRQLPVRQALYARILTLLHEISQNIYCAIYYTPISDICQDNSTIFLKIFTIPIFSITKTAEHSAVLAVLLSSRNDSLNSHKIQKVVCILLVLGLGRMSARSLRLPNVHIRILSAKCLY